MFSPLEGLTERIKLKNKVFCLTVCVCVCVPTNPPRRAGPPPRGGTSTSRSRGHTSLRSDSDTGCYRTSRRSPVDTLDMLGWVGRATQRGGGEGVGINAERDAQNLRPVFKHTPGLCSLLTVTV